MNVHHSSNNFNRILPKNVLQNTISKSNGNKQPYEEVQLAIVSKPIPDSEPISEVYQLKLLLTQALKSLFGDIGRAIPVDILKFDPSESSAILRCPPSSFVRVRAALTLTDQAIIQTKRASNLLLSLSSNSRQFKHY